MNTFVIFYCLNYIVVVVVIVMAYVCFYKVLVVGINFSSIVYVHNHDFYFFFFLKDIFLTAHPLILQGVNLSQHLGGGHNI